MDPTLLSKPLPQIEEWFLARVEETPLQTDDLLAVLKAVGADPERRAAAESWSDLLLERLKKERDVVHGETLVELKASWMTKPETEIRAACDKLLSDLFARETVGRNFVPGAGFRDRLPLAECFRRFRLLMSVKPGAFCVHKSWGPGTVKRLDDFYSKVVIDFAGRPNHEMGYAFVAESLELPGEDHLLAIRYRHPDKLAAMIREQPGEVVRITLRSFGPMPLARLQQTLSPGIIPSSEMKPFWDAARRQLVAAGDCEIPAKKLEPIRLIDKGAAPVERWVGKLGDERRLEVLTVMFEELLQDRDRPKGNAEFDRLVSEKMGHVIYGAAGSREELVVRTMLAAHSLGLTPVGADLGAMRGRWLNEKTFKSLLNDLPVRLVQDFILLVTNDLADGVPLLLKLIPVLNLSPMSESINLLQEKERGVELKAALRQVAYGRKENILFLCWMARNLDRVKDWNLVPLEELPFRIIEMLRGSFMHETLRAANGIKLLLNDREWLQRTVGAMDDVRRGDFLRLVREPDAAMYFDAQALLGRMIVLFPELAAAFESDVTKPVRPTSGLTSWRTYTRRQRQFERLVNIEIPKNARDIEIARSYGDLRENHEYKTAKEMQGILLRRKDEMHHELQTVRGTDFEGFSAEAAGMGVQVDLEYAGGEKATYTILGEWDQDPERYIISCQSGLGKRLEGLKPGDPVAVPDAEGKDREARLTAVRPLPPEIREWVKDMNAP